MEQTSSAAGAKGRDWASEAGPRSGKNPGSEEEDASGLSYKVGVGGSKNGFKHGTRSFYSSTDFLVLGSNSLLSDPLKNSKRLPCLATNVPPCTSLPERQGSVPLPSPAASAQHSERAKGS